MTEQESKYVNDANQLLVVEIQKGIEQLKQNRFDQAIAHFVQATNIAPYDPKAYEFLVESMIHIKQEDLAYQVLERAGHNNTDSNAIIKALYNNLSAVFGEESPVKAPSISLAQFRNNKDCAVSFMFDDGEPSVASAILPMFEQYGWRTTIAINPGRIPASDTDPYRAGWTAWNRALLNGHEIANHGMNHIPLVGLKTEKLKEEIEDSRQAITDNLGIAPLAFVFPEDKNDAESLRAAGQTHIALREHDALRQLYERVFIPVFGGKYFSSDSGRMLLEIAMQRKLWLIPECHGLISPYIQRSFKSISPELLRDQLEFMNKNIDRIWVARFITVFTYLTERKATEIKVLESTDHGMVFELKNKLDKNLFSIRLTVLINPAPARPTKTQALLQATKTWIDSSVDKNGMILVNVLPNSGPVEIHWE